MVSKENSLYLAQESGDADTRSNNASSFVADVSNTVVNSLIANKTSSSETHLVRIYLIANIVMMPVLKRNESIKSMDLLKTRHMLVSFPRRFSSLRVSR